MSHSTSLVIKSQGVVYRGWFIRTLSRCHLIPYAIKLCLYETYENDKISSLIVMSPEMRFCKDANYAGVCEDLSPGFA
jgi:hypothetical protein